VGDLWRLVGRSVETRNHDRVSARVGAVHDDTAAMAARFFRAALRWHTDRDVPQLATPSGRRQRRCSSRAPERSGRAERRGRRDLERRQNPSLGNAGPGIARSSARGSFSKNEHPAHERSAAPVIVRNGPITTRRRPPTGRTRGSR
jgi:hypothetical protein